MSRIKTMYARGLFCLCQEMSKRSISEGSCCHVKNQKDVCQRTSLPMPRIRKARIWSQLRLCQESKRCMPEDTFAYAKNQKGQYLKAIVAMWKLKTIRAGGQLCAVNKMKNQNDVCQKTTLPMPRNVEKVNIWRQLWLCQESKRGMPEDNFAYAKNLKKKVSIKRRLRPCQESKRRMPEDTFAYAKNQKGQHLEATVAMWKLKTIRAGGQLCAVNALIGRHRACVLKTRCHCSFLKDLSIWRPIC